MFVANGDLSFSCSTLQSHIIEDTQHSWFDIFAPCNPDDVKRIFADDKFYFYDPILNGRLPDTDNKQLVGLSITSNADSTCRVIIKLTRKGVVDDES